MTIANVGLFLFVLSVALNVSGLLLDLALFLSGLPTVTGAVGKDPLLGAPILILQVVGLAGLCAHFYARA